ncbi:peptidylprolyl isomerase [Paenibacillus sp.]|uniref:peptidylprolyl isomerase n=1 Tax=Paenibacillus sp. TaxID=58172 RepID=UPI002D73D59D|nr:peptidyl-prolyl cis-trans isomerase [Paenibacillus sp.]HZG55783.1 peptidyl-prolyl cis-trans isomerase [Paenibacillus sp.]
MSREKWLWGLCGTLTAIAAVLAFMLVQATKPAADAPPAGEVRPVDGDAGPGGGAGAPDGGASDAGSPGGQNGPDDPKTRKIAQAGSAVLYEEAFVRGLRETFGAEYAQQWMKQTVVRLEAQALGLNVSRADIDEELERMQVGYESEAEFYRVMREQLGLTEQELREDALYRLMLEGIATAQVQVTEADVEAYIEAHPEEFAPLRDLRYAQIVVGSEESAAAVLRQLGEGVDFELLAKDVSLDTATAAAGGDSGWIPEDDPFIPPEIAQALEGMRVGDVSPAIRLEEDGRWAVVTLLGRRTIDPLDDSSVRKDLRRELALAEAPSLFDVETMLLRKYNAVDFLESD